MSPEEEEKAERADRLRQIVDDPGFAAHTIDRLRDERDQLRNEVVRLRGDVPHRYVPDLDPTKLGQTLQFECERCNHRTPAPVHAYFDPCTG